MSTPRLPRHVAVNRDLWNATAGDWVAAGEKLWALDAPVWGIWELPEAALQLLPTDMTEMRTIELGCGTGYVSGWMTRRGATATGIDISRAQLDTARRLAALHGVDLTLIEGSAETVDAPDAGFDFAISEYGAAIWCDPMVWLREAHRLLRPGGACVFLGHHPLTLLCTPPDSLDLDTRLHHPYRGLHSADWTADAVEPGGIEFNLTFSDWLRLFGEIGFEITHYQELYAPDDATGAPFGIPAEWARDFPSEQVWHLRKPG